MINHLIDKEAVLSEHVHKEEIKEQIELKEDDSVKGIGDIGFKQNNMRHYLTVGPKTIIREANSRNLHLREESES